MAFARRYRDPRVSASVILSGAMMSGIGGYSFSPAGPALLAMQGTADTFNEPHYTYAYFAGARRPKYLLRLIGAEHLPPYTSEQPQLSIVERVEHRVPARLSAAVRCAGGAARLARDRPGAGSPDNRPIEGRAPQVFRVRQYSSASRSMRASRV